MIKALLQERSNATRASVDIDKQAQQKSDDENKKLVKICTLTYESTANVNAENVMTKTIVAEKSRAECPLKTGRKTLTIDGFTVIEKRILLSARTIVGFA